MKLYEEIGEHLGISAKEVQRRLCDGEPLVHLYYQWKYNDEIPF